MDSNRDDILYYCGSEESQLKAQKKFAAMFKLAPGKVLEIGCGKGAILTLMKQQGIEAYGIDISEESIVSCQEKGLEAYRIDVLSHLQKIPDATLGGIFCAHVIEHLTPEKAMKLIKEAYRVLKSNGVLLLITPNPKDIRTTERFWLDVTHVRPYPEKLLKYLLEKEGFKKIKAFPDKEPAKNIFERIVKMIVRLWFLGYMFVGDLVIIGEK